MSAHQRQANIGLVQRLLWVAALVGPALLRAGAQTAPDLGTVRLVSNAYQAMRAEMNKREGVFIRTHWNDGCVDAGCCSLGFRQVQFNKDCPPWSWMKWSFNGPMLVVHKPLMNMCLECHGGRRDSVVGTARCSGSRSQQWHLRMLFNRPTTHGNLLFTIRSSLYPDQCVTVDASSESGGLVLRNCTTSSAHNRQLFYLNSDWFQLAMAMQTAAEVNRALGSPADFVFSSAVADSDAAVDVAAANDDGVNDGGATPAETSHVSPANMENAAMVHSPLQLVAGQPGVDGVSLSGDDSDNDNEEGIAQSKPPHSVHLLASIHPAHHH